MTQELVGIDAVHSFLNEAWNENYGNIIKEKFLKGPESDLSGVISEMADHAAGSVNINDPVLVSDLITDYLNDRIDVNEKNVDALIEVQRSNGPRDFITNTVLRIINDQAYQIFAKRFEEAKKDWGNELGGKTHKGPGE